MAVIVFRGGTQFAVLAQQLVDHIDVGSWLVPARVEFDDPVEADAFDKLMFERGVEYIRESK